MPKKTEAQTRQQIIDQRLKKADWDVNDPSQVTSEREKTPESAVKAFSGVNISDWLPRLDEVRTWFLKNSRFMSSLVFVPQ